MDFVHGFDLRSCKAVFWVLTKSTGKCFGSEPSNNMRGMSGRTGLIWSLNICLQMRGLLMTVLDLAHRDLSAVLGSVIKKTTYTI